MFFDPLSTWLVTLIADGIIVAGEKSGNDSGKAYDQKRVKQVNDYLNAQLRQVKGKYGLDLPEMAYNRVQLQIKAAQESFPIRQGYGPIVIELDNQEYIISLLDACAKWYSVYDYDEAQKKADWYRKAATEARRQKAMAVKKIKEQQTKELANSGSSEKLLDIGIAVGVIITIALLFFFFA